MRVLVTGATGRFAGLVVPAVRQMPAGPMKDGLLAMFADYTAHGFRGGNGVVLRTILGRAPRSLEDFFAELGR